MHPISILLCEVYEELYKRGEVAFPLYDAQIDGIDSIVKTINAGYFGVERFPRSSLKAAAYFCHLINGHKLVDGNKRLAVLWLQTYCDISGLEISMKEGVTLDALAVAVEERHKIDSELIHLVELVLFYKLLSSNA